MVDDSLAEFWEFRLGKWVLRILLTSRVFRRRIPFHSGMYEQICDWFEFSQKSAMDLQEWIDQISVFSWIPYFCCASFCHSRWTRQRLENSNLARFGDEIDIPVQFVGGESAFSTILEIYLTDPVVLMHGCWCPKLAGALNDESTARSKQNVWKHFFANFD